MSTLEIIKRNGTIVNFDIDKIKNAIRKAMKETTLGIDEEVINDVSINIFKKAEESKEYLSVDDIQNLVEELLMGSNRKDVAKAYIVYRFERDKKRNTKQDIQERLLSDKFISKYKHIEPPMTTLGHFVYLRTYSRWLQEEGRREYWWETVRRAVEYNCSLVKTSVAEAEELYDNIFNLKQFLSGRTFWVGGTKVSKSFSSGNFNCFRENTEFLTRYGITTFKNQKDGDIVEVLDKNGGWVPSRVRNYGKAKLYKLTVAKRGTKYTEDIYTTDNHLWFTKKYDSYITKTTLDLNPGDILKYQRRYKTAHLNMDPFAIIHGIVYGDGSYHPDKNHCQVRLCGDKAKLINYFKGYPSCPIKGTDDIFVYGLPYNFKVPPTSYANVEYIKGFLLGLMLTDGSLEAAATKNQSLKISLTDPYHMKHIQNLFEIIGITTNQLKEEYRTNNNFNSENRFYYTLVIHKDAFFYHYPEFKTSTTSYKETIWEVKSVEETDLIEDVWCVEVPTTQSFTLRGGIHTHNCAFEIIDSFDSFRDLFYLLMVGAGVGIRILKEDVDKMPKIRTNYKLINEDYTALPKNKRLDSTSLTFTDNNTATITIGDSKEGWSEGLKFYFDLLSKNTYKNIDTIIINYDHVRPKGEPLKTFGGTASGHGSIKTMFIKINKLIQRYSNISNRIQLKPIDCLDIANIIGENVVVGGKLNACFPH